MRSFHENSWYVADAELFVRIVIGIDYKEFTRNGDFDVELLTMRTGPIQHSLIIFGHCLENNCSDAEGNRHIQLLSSCYRDSGLRTIFRRLRGMSNATPSFTGKPNVRARLGSKLALEEFIALSSLLAQASHHKH